MVTEPVVPAVVPPRRRRVSRAGHIAIWVAGGVVFLVLVVLLWNLGSEFINGETESDAVAYLIIAGLVFGDALCALLPGETTLNAGAILASNGQLDIALVIVAGAIGAVTGDSTVYWLARSAHGRIREWMDKVAAADQSKQALDLLRRHGSVFLLFGRYIPGVRLALNVTLGGIVRMPYPRFLFWSLISGTLWATVTSLAAYYISTALIGYPLVSFVITTFLSTTVIVTIVWMQRRRSRHRAAQTAA